MSKNKVEELKERLADLNAEGEEFCIDDYNKLVKDVIEHTNDKVWAAKICKKVEGKITKRGGFFYDYCELAEFVMDNLEDRKWAIKLLKKAEANVGDTMGCRILDKYSIDDEDSCYAILATRILNVLDDETWAADVIVYAVSECREEQDVAPINCTYLMACRGGELAGKVWGRLMNEADLSDVQCFKFADAIMTIDGRLYENGRKNEYEKDEDWHQENIKWAKSFMRKGIEAMVDYSESTSFDLPDAEEALKILKDPELNKLYADAKKKLS
jgi:hypothetical protein